MPIRCNNIVAKIKPLPYWMVNSLEAFQSMRVAMKYGEQATSNRLKLTGKRIAKTTISPNNTTLPAIKVLM